MSYKKRFLHFLIERDGEFCAYCGSSENLNVDHFHPKSKGGTDNLDNLKVACWACNCSKKDKTIENFRISESVKRTSFHGVINYKQYQALLKLKLIKPINLIDFYFELNKGE